jgi:hypothetical protein
MNEFDAFETTYGAPQSCERLDDAAIESYAARLPDEVLDRWRETGVCSHGDGLLWFTDPKQLDDVLEDWLKAFELESGAVFLRTAFAHLYIWASGAVCSIDVQHGGFSRVTDNIDLFFSLLTDEDIRERILRASLYEEVKQRLGPPDRNECYAFVPALALGGPGTAESVQRVQLREHLGILSQLVLGE